MVALEALDSLGIRHCNDRHIDKYLNELLVECSRFLSSISTSEAHNNVKCYQQPGKRRCVSRISTLYIGLSAQKRLVHVFHETPRALRALGVS